MLLLLLLLLLPVAGSASECENTLTSSVIIGVYVNPNVLYTRSVTTCGANSDHYSIVMTPGALLSVTAEFRHDEGDLDIWVTTGDHRRTVLASSRTETDDESLVFTETVGGTVGGAVDVAVRLTGARPNGQAGQTYTITIDVNHAMCGPGTFLDNGKCRPCPYGMFNIGFSTATTCETRPTCPENQYDRTRFDASLAPDCHATCLPGAEPDTISVDDTSVGVCYDCTAGKYSADGGPCTDYTPCTAGLIESTTSTATQDIECVSCVNVPESSVDQKIVVDPSVGDPIVLYPSVFFGHSVMYLANVTTCGDNSGHYSVVVASGETMIVFITLMDTYGDLDIRLFGVSRVQKHSELRSTRFAAFTNKGVATQSVPISIYPLGSLSDGRGGQRYRLAILVRQTHCGPGEFLGDEECDPCPDGQFKAGMTNATACTVWAPACTGGVAEARSPSSVQNRVCRSDCPDGQYDRAFEDPRQNLDCHATCLAGTEPVTRNVDGDVFGVCVGCKEGNYSADGLACTARTACPANQYDRVYENAALAPDCQTTCLPGTEPSSLADVLPVFGVCTRCEAGKYSVDGTACIAYTICTAGLIASVTTTTTQDTACIPCANTFETDLDTRWTISARNGYDANVTVCGYTLDSYEVFVASGATLTVTFRFERSEGELTLEVRDWDDDPLSVLGGDENEESLEFARGASAGQPVLLFVKFLETLRPDGRGGQRYTLTIDVTQTQCPAGEFLQNGKCDPCPAGQFKIGTDAATSCTPGNACAASGVATPVTPTSDAVCRVCPAGKHVGSGDPLMALFGMADGSGACETCQGNTVQPRPNSAEPCRPCNDPLVANTAHTACSMPLVLTSSAARAAAGVGVVGLLMMAVVA